ncbi:uncharacterized protein EV154DRAFT_578230 [Mucor mucedo]|uniref:uncharacterized protein n=1 Tax=Mucor mucedo TaxID=29922 RepID=UPI00222016F7|nr:uncharacterized protein EV154DRAFT_578230 [Mucor mucedo]KAI7894625.1 hypothetical protein EV154DRAFT_578230 [Mucor mucedo]
MWVYPFFLATVGSLRCLKLSKEVALYWVPRASFDTSCYQTFRRTHQFIADLPTGFTDIIRRKTCVKPLSLVPYFFPVTILLLPFFSLQMVESFNTRDYVLDI